jgi:hypothetical protein
MQENQQAIRDRIITCSSASNQGANGNVNRAQRIGKKRNIGSSEGSNV